MEQNVEKMLTENRDAVTRAAVRDTARLYEKNVSADDLCRIYGEKTLELGVGADLPTAGGVIASFHSPAFNGVRHSHDFFEMSFVISGEVTDETGGEKITLEAGDAIIHTPRSNHKICACTDPEGLINVVLSREMLTDSFYSSLLRDKNLETAFYCRAPQTSGAFPVRGIGESTRAVVNLLLGELASEERSQTVIESTLLLLLAQLLRGYKSAPRDLKSAIGAYIAENLTSVTLPETARAFGYNPKYFSGLFRKLFGKNFVDIVRDSRLDYAATLVGFTDYSVEKIAELVGYRDPASLYDGFRLRFSTTPAAMRRKN